MWSDYGGNSFGCDTHHQVWMRWDGELGCPGAVPTATFYEGCGFGGATSRHGAGADLNMSQTSICDGCMSSLRVAAGLTVTLWTGAAFTGPSITFAGPAAVDFCADPYWGWNDQVGWAAGMN